MRLRKEASSVSASPLHAPEDAVALDEVFYPAAGAV